MRTIRPINEEEVDDFIAIISHAYPGIDISDKEGRQRFRSRVLKFFDDSGVGSYALFEDGEMRGIMRLYDFTMNLLSTRTLVGGVGGVGVDLLHKKEQVAADMLRFFHNHYKRKGACLTALYPFRPDFYRRMGYGYGTKRGLYRVRPDSLPKGPGRAQTAYLTVGDKEAVQACYDRFMSRNNGLMERHSYRWDEAFSNSALHFVGIKRQGQLTGYLLYKFEKGPQGHFLNNDMLIREFVYDSADDLLELMHFLHIQADQINRVIFYTQDEFFHFLLHDPRNDSGRLLPQVYHETNTQGVGIMYRVIDVPRLFQVLKDHNFGEATCRLKITLEDTFLPENAGSYMIHFENGRCSIADGESYDVEIQMDIAEFSSLVVGAINFKVLNEYGLASISNSAYVTILDRLFAAPKPICFTEF